MFLLSKVCKENNAFVFFDVINLRLFHIRYYFIQLQFENV